MASPQQSRIQSYLERNKIGPLFEELMTKLITETPDHPIPFLIDHLQTKQDSPGKLHRALSGSAALWAQSSPENKNPRREHSNYEKPWQIHPKKPKKSKSDLAVSSISPPSPESKSLPRSIEYPSWDWRESRDFDELNHILQESKKLGKALESLSRSIAISDELDQNLGGYNSVLRPRVVGEWVGREENDADPLAAEMLHPPVPRAKTEVCWSGDSSPAGSLKMETKSKGLKEQQQHHKKLLAAMLSQDSFDSVNSPAHSVVEEEIEDEDDAMELLEDLDDLRMEGVTGLAPSGSKFSQGRSSYQPEPQAKVTLNICSRCARLQGDTLSDSRSEEEHRPHVSEQAVPDISCKLQFKLKMVTSLYIFVVLHFFFSVLPLFRQAVWEADLKAVRGGSSVGQTGLLLGDSLFSKELENMGKQLAEVEKDLAKLAEVGKMTSRSTNNPHSSLLHTPLRHRTLPDTLPLPSLVSRPQSPASSLSGKSCGIGLPLLSPKPTSLVMGRTQSPSNPGSRTQTPRTPSRPLTPNSLLTRSNFSPGSHKEVTFRRSRSRPVTPTSQPTHPRPLLTPPGLSTTDSLGASLRAYLSEDEFYQQLQAIRQPWHIPSDTDSDILEPPEQDKSEWPN
uniref:Chromosome 8 open reading frame 34 n=1 Tax=Acanthochromis polyacanthus TaxID=80966 RepID=A0A3Q1GX88_9TELE